MAVHSGSLGDRVKDLMCRMSQTNRQRISTAGEGVWGPRVKIDSTWNVFFNDTGTANGCKGGDLKVLATQTQTLPDAIPPIGQVHPFSKMAVTFEPLKEF